MFSFGFFFLENIKEFDDSDVEKDVQRKMNLYILLVCQLFYLWVQVKFVKIVFSFKMKYENFLLLFFFFKRCGICGILYLYFVYNGKEMYRDL